MAHNHDEIRQRWEKLTDLMLDVLVVTSEAPKAYFAGLLGWPRLWTLLGHLLPRRVRKKWYEPGRHDLLLDHLEARRFRSKWARRWLNFCLSFKTALLFVGCWRVLLAQTAFGWVLRLMPERVRRWWTA
jgi:hypothetical protein